MKKIIIWISLLALLMSFAGCSSKKLTTTGVEVIHTEDDYVTFQIVCDHCGYHYGDPKTAKVINKIFFTLVCNGCNELMYIRLERG